MKKPKMYTFLKNRFKSSRPDDTIFTELRIPSLSHKHPFRAGRVYTECLRHHWSQTDMILHVEGPGTCAMDFFPCSPSQPPATLRGRLQVYLVPAAEERSPGKAN